MANLLSKQLRCPKTDHSSEKHNMLGTNLKWMLLAVNIKGPLYMLKWSRNGH